MPGNYHQRRCTERTGCYELDSAPSAVCSDRFGRRARHTDYFELPFKAWTVQTRDMAEDEHLSDYERARALM
jgi:hypothetical protein